MTDVPTGFAEKPTKKQQLEEAVLTAPSPCPLKSQETESLNGFLTGLPEELGQPPCTGEESRSPDMFSQPSEVPPGYEEEVLQEGLSGAGDYRGRIPPSPAPPRAREEPEIPPVRCPIHDVPLRHQNSQKEWPYVQCVEKGRLHGPREINFAPRFARDLFTAFVRNPHS